MKFMYSGVGSFCYIKHLDAEDRKRADLEMERLVEMVKSNFNYISIDVEMRDVLDQKQWDRMIEEWNR